MEVRHRVKSDFLPNSFASRYSSLRGTALEELVPKEVRLAIAEALTDEEREEKIEPKVWRWYLRGLKPACALKKVRVDAEISTNFRSK